MKIKPGDQIESKTKTGSVYDDIIYEVLSLYGGQDAKNCWILKATNSNDRGIAAGRLYLVSEKQIKSSFMPVMPNQDAREIHRSLFDNQDE
jgi:hypothetical protein